MSDNTPAAVATPAVLPLTQEEIDQARNDWWPRTPEQIGGFLFWTNEHKLIARLLTTLDAAVARANAVAAPWTVYASFSDLAAAYDDVRSALADAADEYRKHLRMLAAAVARADAAETALASLRAEYEHIFAQMTRAEEERTAAVAQRDAAAAEIAKLRDWIENDPTWQERVAAIHDQLGALTIQLGIAEAALAEAVQARDAEADGVTHLSAALAQERRAREQAERDRDEIAGFFGALEAMLADSQARGERWKQAAIGLFFQATNFGHTERHRELARFIANVEAAPASPADEPADQAAATAAQGQGE